MEQIKISEKMAEYVENLEQVEHILNQCEYNIQYHGITTDNGYEQRTYILYINDIKFNYAEGIGLEKLNNENKQDKMLNAVWCLLIDRQCVNYADNNEYNFICEYGYNKNAQSMAKGHKVYNDILNNNEKLLKCFNSQQLDFLTDNIQL